MSEDDQTESETKKPRTRGTRPTDRSAADGGEPQTMQTMAATGGPAQGGAFPQQRRMPWDQGQGGMPWGGGQAAPNGNTGVVGPQQAGGHPAFQWGGQGQGGGPNWQALAQQFAQRFAQNNPFLQRLGMTGQRGMPPGQAPAAPPQGQPGGTPPIWAGPQAAQGQPQPGAAPQFAPQIQRLAAMFGRQQPGGIVGPGQGPQNY